MHRRPNLVRGHPDGYKEKKGYHRARGGAPRSTARLPSIVPQPPSLWDPTPPFQQPLASWLRSIGPRPSMAASSDHGDIKDACNGTNGGACAHSLALEAVQPRLHHARLVARHLAQRQHGMRCSWRSRHGSCRCMDFKPIELLIAAWLLKLGPRLTKSNIEYVILQGSQFHRTKWRVLAAAAGWTSCRGGPVSGCSLRPTTSASKVLLLHLEHSSHALPRPPCLTNVERTQGAQWSVAGSAHRLQWPRASCCSEGVSSRPAQLQRPLAARSGGYTAVAGSRAHLVCVCGAVWDVGVSGCGI